jgi:hypothetical protein
MRTVNLTFSLLLIVLASLQMLLANFWLKARAENNANYNSDRYSSF